MSIREQITALITAITSSDANKIKSKLCEAVLRMLLLLFQDPNLKNQLGDICFATF